MYFPLRMERTLLLERHQCLNTTSSNVHYREVVVVDSRGECQELCSSAWTVSKLHRLTILSHALKHKRPFGNNTKIHVSLARVEKLQA